MTFMLHRHTEYDYALEAVRTLLNKDDYMPTELSEANWESLLEYLQNEAASTSFTSLSWAEQRDFLLMFFPIPELVVHRFPSKSTTKFPFSKLYDDDDDLWFVPGMWAPRQGRWP